MCVRACPVGSTVCVACCAEQPHQHARRKLTRVLLHAGARTRAQWDENHIDWNFDVNKGPIHVEWFKGGTTNICYNALDRHVKAGEC